MKETENSVKLHLALSPYPLAIFLIPYVGEGSCYSYFVVVIVIIVVVIDDVGVGIQNKSKV